MAYKNKKSQNNYNHSKKGVLRRLKYQYSEKGKTTTHIYQHSEKGKLALQKADVKYAQSEKGRITTKKGIAKRKRNLGFISLMSNPFPEEIPVDYHHINNVFVIPIPRQVHKNMLGKNHRREVNNWIEEYIGLIGV